jgi:hypothetical protein
MGGRLMGSEKQVARGILSSSYYTDSKDTKHEEIFSPSKLDFILGHFEERVWPRTIFTKTLGK